MSDTESKSATPGTPPAGVGRLEPGLTKELAEIRKEVVESRNLVIKTDNLLKNLHAELKQVASRQGEIARRGWIGSFVAYALIAALCAGGASMVISAGTHSQHEEVASLTHQVEELHTNQVKLEKEAADRKLAAEQAVRAYAAIADGTPDSRLRGVDALANLDRSRLSPLEGRALDDRAKLLKGELAGLALDEGRNAFHRQDYPTAAAQLSRFLTLMPDSPDALQASLFLGNSYHALKQWSEGIPPLERFVAQGKGMKSMDYAMFMLGQCYEMTGEHGKAIDILTRGIMEHPASEFIPAMRHVLTQAHASLVPVAPIGPRPGAAPLPAPAPVPAPAPAPAPAPRAAPASASGPVGAKAALKAAAPNPASPPPP